MILAFYKGKSIVSKLIRWFTRGDYSHVAVMFNDGFIVEAWHNPSKVRTISHLGEGHEVGTVVDLYEVHLKDEYAARLECVKSLGLKYDFLGVLGFVARWTKGSKSKLFCSELAMKVCAAGNTPLLERISAYKVSPSALATSPLLVRYGRAITGKTRTRIDLTF